MGEGYAVIIVIGVVLLVLGLVFWSWARAARMLEGWARSHGYEILRCERRFVRLGPLFWTTSKGQVVFDVTVRDAKEGVRRGWVRCGSWLWGILSDKVTVRWDEEDAPFRGQ